MTSSPRSALILGLSVSLLLVVTVVILRVQSGPEKDYYVVEKPATISTTYLDDGRPLYSIVYGDGGQEFVSSSTAPDRGVSVLIHRQPVTSERVSITRDISYTTTMGIFRDRERFRIETYTLYLGEENFQLYLDSR